MLPTHIFKSHPPAPPDHYPLVLLLQLCSGPGQLEGEFLPLQQAVVLAEQLQVLETGLGAQQLVFCVLELPCQIVTAGAGLMEHPLQESGLVVVFGEDLGPGVASR